MASRGSKTGGGVGTNQHQIKGRSVDHDTAAAGRARAGGLDHDIGFVFNGNPDDVDQVAPHFDDYADAFQQAAAADETFRRHVEQMRGMIPALRRTGISMAPNAERTVTASPSPTPSSAASAGFR